MNSEIVSVDPALLYNSYGTIILAWSSVAFSIVSCGIIGRKAIHECNQLRSGCFVMGVLTLTLCITNVLRIPSIMLENPFFLLESVLMILFVNLLVAITFNLGGKFYNRDERINLLYWITIAATGFSSLLGVLSLILWFGLQLLEAGSIMNKLAQFMSLSAVFLAYWYAFNPVISIQTGSSEVSSAVVAVGIWYLGGMAIIIVLNIIPLALDIVYPGHIYKEIDINLVCIAVFLRMAFLDFYSLPPSSRIILAIRKRFVYSPFDDEQPPNGTTAMQVNRSNGTTYHYELGLSRSNVDDRSTSSRTPIAA